MAADALITRDITQQKVTLSSAKSPKKTLQTWRTPFASNCYVYAL